ncbi:hypothetical protein [Clostridium pasteurianum]|uniref:Uncharacterized protein n=1 Tax=Clostridium pasteurianum BC1 TaxID=86416 RepID=R4K2P4_CLOPA|nr:hypothetical protein [Clostridium pasteurianum]AGK97377.1 hypothetical protein Clopa_2516 [Clostridium pasteurianum BC1]
MGKRLNIQIDRAKELYEKYGTLARAALSLGCSPTTLKRLLIENGVEIKPYVAKRWNVNSIRY